MVKARNELFAVRLGAQRLNSARSEKVQPDGVVALKVNVLFFANRVNLTIVGQDHQVAGHSGGIGQELFQAAFLQVLVGLEILETVEASFHGTQ